MTPAHTRAQRAPRRRAMLLAASALTLIATGCGTATSALAQRQPFDVLDLHLGLAEERVAGGRSVGGTLTVTNQTEAAVTDTACHLGAGRAGLVPVGEEPTDEHLWSQPIVDCGGPSEIRPGESLRIDYRFLARTRYGVALAPGQYQATVRIEGLSEPLVWPVKVT